MTSSTISDMLQSHPGGLPVDRDLLAECIAACFECAQACSTCASACLSEEGVADLRTCIRTDLDCADLCDTTGRILSRWSEDGAEVIRAVLEACLRACESCGDECDGHAGMHDHCRVCAEACRRCGDACRRLLGAMSAGTTPGTSRGVS